MSVRRNRAPMRIIDQPYDHGRSQGCFLPSCRLISSRLKNRHLTSTPPWSRTSRIHSDAWYAHGHMTSKWKSTAVGVVTDATLRLGGDDTHDGDSGNVEVVIQGPESPRP